MYQALYRKWRPAAFADMSGQDAVRAVLRSEVASGRLSHAYLFCGTRGTGKTTAAKILAKAANCLAPVGGDPCNECEMCRGIDDGSVLDVVEIDAASNNGVENVREIREQVQYTPARARYRVYIIDEVHMLSSGAFNALLKTLEEPPEHVIFILATTERHKIPATIISRCQCFEFSRIPTGEIAARLLQVSKSEGIELTQEAAALIARLADGAMRNALTILDPCAISGGEVTADTVGRVAGLAQREYLFDISRAISKGDVGGLLAAVSGAALQSKDLLVIVGELMTHLRDLLVIKTVAKPDELLKSPPSEFEALKRTADGFEVSLLLEALRKMQSAAFEISRSPVRQTLLEVVLLELCGEQPLAAVRSRDGGKRQTVDTASKAISAESPSVDAGDEPPWFEDEPLQEPDKSRVEPENPAQVRSRPIQTPEQPAQSDSRPIKASAEPLQGQGEAIPAAPAEQRSPTAGDRPEQWDKFISLLDPSVAPIMSTAAVRFEGGVMTVAPVKAFGFRMLSKDSSKADIVEKFKTATGRDIQLRVSSEAQDADIENLAAKIGMTNERER